MRLALLAALLLTACAQPQDDGITGRVVWNAEGCAFRIQPSYSRMLPERDPNADKPECKAKAVRR